MALDGARRFDQWRRRRRLGLVGLNGGKFAAAIVVPGPAFRMHTKIKSVSAWLCKCADALTHDLQHAIVISD
jgi:hypothetical protein